MRRALHFRGVGSFLLVGGLIHVPDEPLGRMDRMAVEHLVMVWERGGETKRWSFPVVVPDGADGATAGLCRRHTAALAANRVAVGGYRRDGWVPVRFTVEDGGGAAVGSWTDLFEAEWGLAFPALKLDGTNDVVYS